MAGLAKLPGDDVLARFFGLGLTIEEIASAYACHPSVVRQHLRRAGALPMTRKEPPVYHFDPPPRQPLRLMKVGRNSYSIEAGHAVCQRGQTRITLPAPAIYCAIVAEGQAGEALRKARA